MPLLAVSCFVLAAVLAGVAPWWVVNGLVALGALLVMLELEARSF